jgi:heme-degrading monooxygenase HmoA
MPLARPGVMILSGWASPGVRAAFRDSDAFQEMERRAQSISLDLGPGKARSQHKEFSLNDDGWISRLPAGKSPRGFVAALTYARVTPRGVAPFHHFARAAALSARKADGFLGSVFATQFRAPALRVMTFTVWDQRTFSTQWAYHGQQPHYDALTWMIESPNLMPGGCFGLFPVLAASGTINGVDIAQRVQELLHPAKTPG